MEVNGINRRELLTGMIVTAGGLLLPGELWAAALVTDARLWTAPDHTRVVFELSRTVNYSMFNLVNPERVVLDLDGVEFKSTLNLEALSDSVVARLRTGYPKPGVTRVVFELKQPIRPTSFVMSATAGRGPRLVLDLFLKSGAAAATAEPTPPPVEPPAGRPAPGKRPHDKRTTVIVFDPGHGGEDPGAIGGNGTREKDIALAMGKKLAGLVNATPGFRAELTRSGDYYVPLRQRVSIARRHNADMFISLHADAFRGEAARGASVYCLSERGKPSPDRAINELVRRENSADLIGGVDLGEVSDPELAGILMDLSQRDSLNRALALGDKLLRSVERLSVLKYKRVMQANFAVLKAPDIPSVLVEMAYISNPQEERMLRDDSYQRNLAQAIFRGVADFTTAYHHAG